MKWIKWIAIVWLWFWVMGDLLGRYELREMQKEELRLSIQVLELQLEM